MEAEWVAVAVSASAALFAAGAALIAHRVSTHQREIAREGLRAQHFASVQTWSDETIDCMAEAHALCFAELNRIPLEGYQNARARLIWRLSSLLDRGRFFFPNLEAQHGAHKPAAYRGLRSAALDHLLGVHRALIALDVQGEKTAAPKADEILYHRREFISAVHDFLSPRTRNVKLLAVLRERKP